MTERTRREFLADVGKGMVVASVGTALATEMGLSNAMAELEPARLSFGSLEPLVDLMQETPIDHLLPALVGKIHSGTELKQLVAAGALANARTFGGEDYVGFHAFMALMPAWEMSRELPASQRALPILKVLYRSSNQIQKQGGKSTEVLKPLNASGQGPTPPTAETLRAAVRKPNLDEAEQVFALLSVHSPEQLYNDIQPIVEDDTDVHRVVLAYRAWAALGLAGREHATTLLRQTVRYCVKSEQGYINGKRPLPGIRQWLPKLVDQYHLLDKPFGNRKADDAWIDKTSQALMNATREQGAEIIAASISEGFSRDSIGEALALAANLQVLRDPGRTQAYPLKPIGSVHGDSYGVHASDSMNAWRNIAAVCDHRNAVCSMIVAGSHVAIGGMGAERMKYSFDSHRDVVNAIRPDALLAEADTAIREQNQGKAAAIVQKYGELGLAPRPVFDLLIRYATSEDGALHAEKYYRTVSEEFARTRPAFRWRQLVGLARVTASEYGKRADGYEEACRLLKV